jgi:hypothetical protein
MAWEIRFVRTMPCKDSSRGIVHGVCHCLDHAWISEGVSEG